MGISLRPDRRDAENRAGCVVRLIFLIIGIGLVLGALAALSPTVLQFGKGAFPSPKPTVAPATSSPPPSVGRGEP